MQDNGKRVGEGRRLEEEGAQDAQRSTGGRGEALEDQEQEQDAEKKQTKQQK